MRRANPCFKLLFLVSALTLFASLWVAPSSNAQTTQPAPIVELRGDGASLGKAHGLAMGAPLRDLSNGFLAQAIGPEQLPAMKQRAMGFAPFLAPEHLAEIKSLAQTAKLDESDVMLLNSFLDLSPMIACSTITLPADAAPDHVARFARNLDFPNLGGIDKASVVLVYHPADRYGFVAIGWPGLIGVLSGMNEHGLALANMEVSRPPGIARAMPYMLLYRTVLERCKTVDEAIELLKTTPRQTPNNLMLMDSAGNRALLELTPDAVTIRRADAKSALISTNHHRGTDADTLGRCKRYDYLHTTAAKDFGKLDRAALVSMLDHVQQEDMTMQSMIFEPANRTIYLSTGMKSPERAMTRIDLATYFKRD